MGVCVKRPRIPADVILDQLALGKRQKEIAYENGLHPTSVESVLLFERRRQNCRTSYELLALHIRRKISGD